MSSPQWGYESEAIFQALGRWASRSPSHDPTLPFGTASLLLSLRTMLDPARAGGIRGAHRLPPRRRDVCRQRSPTGASRSRPARSTAPTSSSPEPHRPSPARSMAAQPLAALEAAGALRIDGDRALAERFVTLFPLPEKAQLPALPAASVAIEVADSYRAPSELPANRTHANFRLGLASRRKRFSSRLAGLTSPRLPR